MIYMPRKYRVASHVGAVRTKLAAAIVQAFDTENIHTRCRGIDLSPSAGYWKHRQQDVMRWEGFVYIWQQGEWKTNGIASWDAMKDCLRGLTIFREGGSFEVAADKQRGEPMASPSERFTVEFEGGDVFGGTPIGEPNYIGGETPGRRALTERGSHD